MPAPKVYCKVCHKPRTARDNHFQIFGSRAMGHPKRELVDLERAWEALSAQERQEAIREARATFDTLAQARPQEAPQARPQATRSAASSSPSSRIASPRAPRPSNVSRAARRGPAIEEGEEATQEAPYTAGERMGPRGWITAGLWALGLAGFSVLAWRSAVAAQEPAGPSDDPAMLGAPDLASYDTPHQTSTGA